jgi:hypothetical protein
MKLLRKSLPLIFLSIFIGARGILLSQASDSDKSPGGDKAEVSKDELGKGKFKFKNRNELRAPLKMIISQIKFGRTAAETLAASPGQAFTSKMYNVKRIYKVDNTKFGADVVTLTPKFRGGHSDVIKRFLIGYIEVAFNYDRQDARLLAAFILHYNGVFRGKIDKFQKDYMTEVVSSLDPKKVGIEKKYTKWPGNTQLIIPLEKNILKDEKKDIPIKEVVKETKTIVKEVPKTEKEKKKLVIFSEKIKKFVAKKKKKEAKDTKDLIKKKKKKLSEIADYIVSENLTDEEKALLKKKADKLKDEIKELEDSGKAGDEVGPTYSKNVKAGKIYVLKTVNYLDKGHYNNRMYIIDPISDHAVKVSDYNNICSREFVFYAKHIVLNGHKGGKHKDHNLVMLDMNDLSMVKKSKYDVFWRSPMIVNKKKLYVIERYNGSYFLARYNKNLKREAISSTDISRDSVMTFFKKKVYVTGSDMNNKKILVFNKADLKLLKKIKTP